MADAYFETTKKGEIHELKGELNSLKEEKKKEAVKKVIAAMTVGKDVSPLFTDVLNCIQTNNLELKKLVYLYVMNYAKTNPDRAILAVNTFQKDSEDLNPLIRALAIRTMGCIRLDKITEYLCDPLRKCLKDRDPYVLKTAAVCVAKLYDIKPELVEEQGFLDMLKDLLGDSNPMVVANAVAALCEIDEVSPTKVFDMNKSNRNKLLAALEECTEWGQVYILNSLAKFTPTDPDIAHNIADRVTPRLQHSNSAVVLAALKVLMKYLDIINGEHVESIIKKMGPPLVTLLSKEPEIQYVALRNINLILQKRPQILENEMKVFFCKYNDPIYVKMEKLEIMIMLVNDNNVEQVLLELKEYATAVDVEFVRKAVRAIGRCAIKLSKASEKCIHVLLDLIKTKVNYVVQEAIIVIKDIFRKYPNRYESIISILCANLESLDEPEAKASMIWIIGEYAERIDNADELLDSFLEGFKDENSMVQLQLLTAVVKLFLKRPKDTQAMVQEVLNLATQESDNPDLRDRGFVYWRLLSTDPEAAKQVVLSEKPLISDDSEFLEPGLLDELIANIATLASVYHKPPETFVPKLKHLNKSQTKSPIPSRNARSSAPKQEAVKSDPTDVFGMSTVAESLPGNDFFNTPQLPVANKQVVLSANDGKGLEISAGFLRSQSRISLELVFFNSSQVPLNEFLIQFNTNTFQLKPVGPIEIQGLMPGQSVAYSLVCDNSGPSGPAASPPDLIQMGIRTNIGIFYFNVPLPIHVIFIESGPLEKTPYLNLWKTTTQERYKTISNLISSDLNLLQRKLEAHNIFFVASRKLESQTVLYMSCQTVNGLVFLLELTFTGTECNLCTRTQAIALVPMVESSVEYLLTHN